MSSFCKCKSYSHFFFSKNISVYAIVNDQSFNYMLTNDIVSFEQLSPKEKETTEQRGLKPISRTTSPLILTQLQFTNKYWVRIRFLFLISETTSVFITYYVEHASIHYIDLLLRYNFINMLSYTALLGQRIGYKFLTFSVQWMCQSKLSYRESWVFYLNIGNKWHSE